MLGQSRQHCRLSICENWLSWTNTVSEQKIPITILILKRGPCLRWALFIRQPCVAIAVATVKRERVGGRAVDISL